MLKLGVFERCIGLLKPTLDTYIYFQGVVATMVTKTEGLDRNGVEFQIPASR